MSAVQPPSACLTAPWRRRPESSWPRTYRRGSDVLGSDVYTTSPVQPSTSSSPTAGLPRSSSTRARAACSPTGRGRAWRRATSCTTRSSTPSARCPPERVACCSRWTTPPSRAATTQRSRSATWRRGAGTPTTATHRHPSSPRHPPPPTHARYGFGDFEWVARVHHAPDGGRPPANSFSCFSTYVHGGLTHNEMAWCFPPNDGHEVHMASWLGLGLVLGLDDGHEVPSRPLPLPPPPPASPRLLPPPP